MRARKKCHDQNRPSCRREAIQVNGAKRAQSFCVTTRSAQCAEAHQPWDQDPLIGLRPPCRRDSRSRTDGAMMSNLFWLSDEQMARLRSFFPKSHGNPRIDDRRVLSGIIFINRNGLRWSDSPPEYGPPKTLYNRWKRWSDMGVFARMMEGLTSEAADRKTVMIDVSRRTPCVRVSLRTYLKAHRTASSLRLKKGGVAG